MARGAVDASAIDSQVLSVALRDDPALAAALRVIDSLGPSAIPPVAVSKRLPAELRSGITEALTNLHREPGMPERLAHGLVERFVPVGAADYDDVRRMLKACEDAGFMTLG